MASGVYNRFKANLMNKIADMEADVVKVMLLDDNHAFNAAHNVIGDVSGNEVAGAGYVAGGVTLANKAVTQATATKFDADDVEWAASTITAHYAVLYDDTIGTDDLICCIDFGENKSTVNGTFKITWNASGIITLT